MDDSLFIKACKRQATERTPIWMMRQAGRYLPEYQAVRGKVDFLTLCKTPELAAEVTIQPVDILGVDVAITFADILLIPEAMGMHLEFLENHGPHFSEPLRSEQDIAKLRVQGVEQELSYVGQTISLVQKELKGKVPVIGFSGAPWTLFAYMVEGGGAKNFIHAKTMLFNTPELAHRLLSKITEVTIAYLKMQIQAGANAVQIFDTWAGQLSCADYQEFALHYVKQIIAALNEEQVPIIYFSKYMGAALAEIAECGADVLSLDWTVDMGKARELVGSKVALQGNLDPIVLFSNPQAIKKHVQEILSSYGSYPGHIFNLGHGILPKTPVDNVKFLVECVKEESVKFH